MASKTDVKKRIRLAIPPTPIHKENQKTKNPLP
jgi:hypothetical protein